MNPFKLKKRGSCLDSYLGQMLKDLQVEPQVQLDEEIEDEPGEQDGEITQKKKGTKAKGTKPKKKSPTWEVAMKIPKNIKSKAIIHIDFKNPEESYVLSPEQHMQRQAQRAEYKALEETLGIEKGKRLGLPERYQRFKEALNEPQMKF